MLTKDQVETFKTVMVFMDIAALVVFVILTKANRRLKDEQDAKRELTRAKDRRLSLRALARASRLK